MLKNLPLSKLKLKQQVRIVDIVSDNKIKNRLISMGLTVGSVISVVHKTKIGNNIVLAINDKCCQARIVLNKKEADLIIVE